MRKVILLISIFLFSNSAFAIKAESVRAKWVTDTSVSAEDICRDKLGWAGKRYPVEARGGGNSIECGFVKNGNTIWSSSTFGRPKKAVCPPDGFPEYINGPTSNNRCFRPKVPYCEEPEVKANIESMRKNCANGLPQGYSMSFKPTCDNTAKVVNTQCDYIPDNGGDIPNNNEPDPNAVGNNGNVNGGGTPNVNTGGGSGGSLTPPSGGGGGSSSGGGVKEPPITVNTGDDDDDNHGNSGNQSGSGSNPKPNTSGSSGSSGGGSHSGSGGSSGGTGGGSTTVIKQEIDLSGVIGAINGHKNKMAGYLDTLQRNSATELQKWDANQALINKYYETAKQAKSSLDHMKNFSEQELATLRELQGQFGTNFDRAYQQNNNLIAATKDLNVTNNQGFDKVDKQIKDSMDKLNQVFADADKADKEKLDELKQANSDKLDEVKQSNSDKLDEIKATIENKTDEQTTALTKSIDGLGDKIDGLELDVDISGIESKLTDVGSKLDDQNGMLAELGKGGQRNLGGCRTRGDCTSFVTSEYPNGLEGIMTSHFETLKNGAFIGVVNQFNMSFPSQAPEWSLCLDIIIDFGCYDIRLPAIVWTFVRICIMFTAFMTCRKLVFGG